MTKQSSLPNSARAHCSVLACSLLGLLLSLGQPSSSHAIDPKEYTLSNDMKVILVEVPKAPVATVQVWYKVGSRNEVMGRAGLSHMLEHMMFKGTAKYPKGTFSRLIRKNGGMDNAFTSQDVTVYQDWFPRSALELIFDLEADVLPQLSRPGEAR